ncbi:hypothetical protein [Streptomyces sp. NPDC047525]|uniref:hypothetical protein n=1 Tax=Streptomyces sp. NPDC047525 TaxID=3155264 RepID=UPI0033E7A83D
MTTPEPVPPSRPQRIREGLRQMPGELRTGWSLLSPRQRRRAAGGAIVFLAGLALSAALAFLGSPAAASLCTLAAVTGAAVTAYLLVQAQTLGGRHVPPSPDVQNHTHRPEDER